MDLCSASDATDSKKRCGEWVGMEQPSFDAKHRQHKQNKVEIQVRDVSDIAPYPSLMYHMLNRLNHLSDILEWESIPSQQSAGYLRNPLQC